MTRSTSSAILPWILPMALVVGLSACGKRDAVAPQQAVLVSDPPMLFTSRRNGNFDIYITEADGSQARRLTFDAGVDQSADWAPDRFKFAFMSNRNGDFEVFVMFSSGRGLRQLTSNTASDGFPRWSPDGSQLLFTSNREGAFDLFVMDADGANVRRLTRNAGDNVGGAWSPDGSRIAFVSTRERNRRDLCHAG